MDTQKASEIIAENLTVKTYEKVKKHFERNGKHATTQQAKEKIENYFYSLLTHRQSENFDNEEAEHKKTENMIAPFYKESITALEKDDISEWLLWLLYIDGYLAGYVTGARDIENLLNDLEERAEP